ncbi:hypothetical protein D3C76_1800780 [compost metagenome]
MYGQRGDDCRRGTSQVGARRIRAPDLKGGGRPVPGGLVSPVIIFRTAASWAKRPEAAGYYFDRYIDNIYGIKKSSTKVAFPHV